MVYTMSCSWSRGPPQAPTRGKMQQGLRTLWLAGSYGYSRAHRIRFIQMWMHLRSSDMVPCRFKTASNFTTASSAFTCGGGQYAGSTQALCGGGQYAQGQAV